MQTLDLEMQTCASPYITPDNPDSPQTAFFPSLHSFVAEKEATY